jgi:hypothetical protein
MADGFFSTYDGLPQLLVADMSRVVQTTPVTETSSAEIFGFMGGGSKAIELKLRTIISKAKLTNRLTEDLVKKYHHSFMHLYDYAVRKIKLLEEEVDYLRSPFNRNATIIEFKPQDAKAKDEMVEWIIRAMNQGVDLQDILPQELMP